MIAGWENFTKNVFNKVFKFLSNWTKFLEKAI